MDSSWVERLLDSNIDFAIYSLIPIGLGLVLAFLAYIGWFRYRLEEAVSAGTSPNTVRLESAAMWLMTLAALTSISGWGFAIIGIVLILSLVIAIISKGRMAIASIAFVLILLVTITILGLRG